MPARSDVLLARSSTAPGHVAGGTTSDDDGCLLHRAMRSPCTHRAPHGACHKQHGQRNLLLLLPVSHLFPHRGLAPDVWHWGSQLPAALPPAAGLALMGLQQTATHHIWKQCHAQHPLACTAMRACAIVVWSATTPQVLAQQPYTTLAAVCIR